jgi:hypothetical protein
MARPRRSIYEVVWTHDGERVMSYFTHAADEADALAHAEAFFAEHPEHDVPCGQEGTIVRVGRVITTDGSFQTVFKEMLDVQKS